MQYCCQWYKIFIELFYIILIYIYCIISFLAPPKILKDLEDKTTTEGSEITFFLTVEGTPLPTIDW